MYWWVKKVKNTSTWSYRLFTSSHAQFPIFCFVLAVQDASFCPSANHEVGPSFGLSTSLKATRTRNTAQRDWQSFLFFDSAYGNSAAVGSSDSSRGRDASLLFTGDNNIKEKKKQQQQLSAQSEIDDLEPHSHLGYGARAVYENAHPTQDPPSPRAAGWLSEPDSGEPSHSRLN
ncbi:hypothetical protein M406DRAFT_74912 [Cryphonectria parasitica EP155]|uniref:Uncharacterized protein n=1 Tax=Cryphonectria parasitica (strain ATCC 38755 / EP155) TaxID=660469 RepID=A0A9P4XVE0_CRYP1|nr:uncharacterized protein M406DRAFT_74912 [Cryphonectria parasitica EP155]KAF3761994.1 hypothetical protein M406DRAFT_74912 [Cryphonectria parasitica EP155]